MEDLNGLSIQFSSVLKELQLDFMAGKRIKLIETDTFLLRLKKADLKLLISDDQKKAFWINIYNGLTNYIIVKKKIKRTFVYRLHLFDTFKLTIGDYQWSLNHIEHGILRKNSQPPYHIRRPFGNRDPRLRQMLRQKDERIHFALIYGGNSNQAIRFYTAEDINEELNSSKQHFLDENFSVDHEKRIISCSPMFKWYRKDFEGKYIFDNLYKEFTVKYSDYNWSPDLHHT